jgi:hypothetical protein
MKKIIFIALLGLAAMACQKTVDTDRTGSVLGFRTNMVETKSTLTTLDGMKTAGFSVVGLLTENSVKSNVFYNQPQAVSYNTSTSKWEYTPSRYWHEEGLYEFTAYAGNVLSTININDKSTIISTDYQIDATQDDLVMAFKQDDMANRNAEHPYVTLNFKHACAAVCLMVVQNGFISDPVLTSIKVNGIVKGGSLRFGAGNTPAQKGTFIWDIADPNTTIDFYYWNNTTGFEVGTTAVPVFSDTRKYTNGSATEFASDANGSVMAIPQTLTDAASVTFTFVNNGVSVTTTKSLKTTDVTTWESGKRYIYTISLEPAKVNVTVRTVEWDEVIGTFDKDINLQG